MTVPALCYLCARAHETGPRPRIAFVELDERRYDECESTLPCLTAQAMADDAAEARASWPAEKARREAESVRDDC